MSNEKHQDDIVSAAYKDLAKERTPERLDRQVLAMAAGSAKRPPYSRWISWARPVAWAATITLCLAITLELARQPEVRPSAAPASGVVPETRKTGLTEDSGDDRRRSDEARLARDKTETSPLLKDRDSNDLARFEESENAEKRAAQSADDTELQQEVADSIANTAAAEKASLIRSAAPQPTETLPGDLPAAAARRQAAEVVESTVPALEMMRTEKPGAFASSAPAGDPDVASMACPKERRSTAENWYECILELREAGEKLAAKREQELFVETFPDFKLP